MIFKIIRARYAAGCTTCGAPIPVGSKMGFHKPSRLSEDTRCMDCMTDLVRDGARTYGDYIIAREPVTA